MDSDRLTILETLGAETEHEITTGLLIAASIAGRVKNYNVNKRKKEKEREYYNSLSPAERIAYDIRKANKNML